MRRVRGSAVLLAAAMRQSLVVGLIHRASTREADASLNREVVSSTRMAEDTQSSPLFQNSGWANYDDFPVLIASAIADGLWRTFVKELDPLKVRASADSC
jgi:hypothetical protein